MLADIFDNGPEKARQAFLDCVRTAESTDAIAHHLLGISSDTTAKMFGLETDKVMEHGRLAIQLVEQCTDALQQNSYFSENEKLFLIPALGEYFRATTFLRHKIDDVSSESHEKAWATSLAFLMSTVFTLGAAVNYTQMDSEISAGRTSPQIYLENRPELREELTAPCAAQEKERAFAVGAHEILQKAEGDPTADQEAVIHYNAANVEACVTGKALQEHLANQEQQKMVGTGLIGGLSGIFGFFAGRGGYQLRKNAQKRAAVKNELMTLRANPFPSIDAA
ncbi:MAG: hypothetical protein KDJ75_04180 [Alphaproteobacteria bacterium]|nr:hypothetical protein [Alphaproteobacteria bacterium]